MGSDERGSAPEHYASLSVGLVNVMSPLVGFIEPIRNIPHLEDGEPRSSNQAKKERKKAIFYEGSPISGTCLSQINSSTRRPASSRTDLEAHIFDDFGDFLFLVSRFVGDFNQDLISTSFFWRLELT